MKIFLFAIFFILLTNNIWAQRICSVVYSSNEKISLESEAFSFIPRQIDDTTFEYTFEFPYDSQTDELVKKLFAPYIEVEFGEEGNFYAPNVNILNLKVILSLSQPYNSFVISIFSLKDNFDTSTFKDKLLKAIQSASTNDSYICDCLPRDIDTVLSKHLQAEIMALLVEKHVQYPPDPFRGYLIEFYVDQKGIGVGKYPNDDTVFVYPISYSFPIVELNGKPVSYKLTPFHLYERYFTNNILKDISSSASNVTLIDEEQRLYFYDIGYAQLYSSYDQVEFGEYYIVELDSNGTIVYKEMTNITDPMSLSKEFYNNDSKPDFVYYSLIQYRDGPPYSTKSILFKDSTWKTETIEFTNYLGGDYYEYKLGNQQLLNDNDESLEMEQPADPLLEDWSSTIFTQKYGYYKELIHAQKKVTDVTPYADLKKKNFKKKYQFEYTMFSVYQQILNYKGNSKAKGDKAIKAILSSMEYYRKNPDKLDSDLKKLK